MSSSDPFTATIVGWAQAAQRVYQIPSSLILSAAKVESNLGAATPPNSNNWFGIKASNGVVSSTREQTVNGTDYTINAAFAVYSSPAVGFMAYARLLGLASPYHDMVTTFLKSARGPADVQVLSNSLTGVYATQKNPPYGSVLIAVQEQYNLYRYDTLPPVAANPPTAGVQPSGGAAGGQLNLPGGTQGTTMAPGTSPIPPAPSPPVAPPVPTVSSAVTIDWGSWAAQILKHEAPIIEAVAAGGEQLILNQIPFGSLISMFIGPQVIQGYIDQGLTALEGMLATETTGVPATNTLMLYVANMINTYEPQIAAFLGANLDPMIQGLVAKAIPSAAAA